MKIWEDHLDFVLGDKVYGLTLKDADSGATYRPRWAQVLNYELELRKEAFRLIRRGKATNLADAMEMARENSRLRQEQFDSGNSISVAVSKSQKHKVYTRSPQSSF